MAAISGPALSAFVNELAKLAAGQLRDQQDEAAKLREVVAACRASREQQWRLIAITRVKAARNLPPRVDRCLRARRDAISSNRTALQVALGEIAVREARVKVLARDRVTLTQRLPDLKAKGEAMFNATEIASRLRQQRDAAESDIWANERALASLSNRIAATERLRESGALRRWLTRMGYDSESYHARGFTMRLIMASVAAVTGYSSSLRKADRLAETRQQLTEAQERAMERLKVADSILAQEMRQYLMPAITLTKKLAVVSAEEDRIVSELQALTNNVRTWQAFLDVAASPDDPMIQDAVAQMTEDVRRQPTGYSAVRSEQLREDEGNPWAAVELLNRQISEGEAAISDLQEKISANAAIISNASKVSSEISALGMGGPEWRYAVEIYDHLRKYLGAQIDGTEQCLKAVHETGFSVGVA